MKYRTETQNIYTHIMAAPDDEALTLQPEMLRELKIWLISDSDETAETFTRDADTIEALRAELAQCDKALASNITAVAASLPVINEYRAENAQLRAQTARDAVTISNLAERLAELGAANPHEEMEI